MTIIDPISLTNNHTPPISTDKGSPTGALTPPRLPTQETTMTIHRTILAATFALAFTGAAHAGDVAPREAKSIDLGAVSGVAYYVVERGGFRVVATLAQGETGTPVRFEALLAPGQSVVLSTPRDERAAGKTIEISRQDDRVLVQDAVVTN
jgi:hypothetical protein